MTSSSAYWVETDDWHTAGEPFRIVSQLPPHCATIGSSVKARRQNIVDTPNHPVDVLRQALCQEPRGHADMYGGFITPPDDAGALFGVLFWHKDGFSTACVRHVPHPLEHDLTRQGHGTIALGCWAVQKGLVIVPEHGQTDVVIDVPSGRVKAQVITEQGKVTKVHFINVPSYQIASNIPVKLSSGIEITLDLGWGGATYALVNVADIGPGGINPKRHDEFVSLGREFKAALGVKARHNDLELYGVCFYEEIGEAADYVEQRNVVVFADGQIDRSPCGSGTAARVAILLAQGKLKGGKKLIHRSIIDTVFEAVILEKADSPTEYEGCIPRVTGLAHLMGEHRFYIDEKDPTYPGFLFR